MDTRRGEPILTRPFAVGAFVFVVETATAADRRLIESLFQDVPPPVAAADDVSIRTFVRAGSEGTTWRVGGRSSGQIAPSLDAALSMLLADVNLSALDAEPGCLHLHAAAATKDDLAVVIAAERNTGKTTTVAHLAKRGWGFVTDETVRVVADGRSITGFPKPLSIKPGGRELVDHLERDMVPAVGDGAEGFHFVSMGASGAEVTPGGRPHLVISLNRPNDGTATDPVVRPLHPADAVVALMQETLDAERFGDAALCLAHLVSRCNTVELTVGSPIRTVEAIDALFRADAPAPLAISMLPKSPVFSPGVVTIAIGDRIVAHDTSSGRIFALDAGAATVWRQIGGWPVADEVDIQSPMIRPFVAQLQALGVLAGAA